MMRDKTQKVLELERQARQLREDELKAEVVSLTAQRDRALALLRRCKQWFDARPRRERPTPLADDINEVLP